MDTELMRQIQEDRKFLNKYPHSGFTHSEETKRKMSLRRLGKPLSEEVKKKIGLANRGYRIKDRTKLVVNEKKHLDSRYKDWMLNIRNRDNWVCRMSNNDCGGRLEAHHIFNWIDYPELRYEVNNGITLCYKHHPRGRKNEEIFVPIFKELILSN